MQNYEDWMGMTAIDMNGEEVGTIADLYTEEGEGGNPEAQPKWATIQSGMFGAKTVFVPLNDAEVTDGGIKLTVPVDKISSAPSVDPDGFLSTEEEEVLYRHYDLNMDEDDVEDGEAADMSDETTSMEGDPQESLVGEGASEAHRLRLRKYVVSKPTPTGEELQEESVDIDDSSNR